MKSLLLLLALGVSATPPSEGIAGGEARGTRRGDIPKAVSPLVPRSATALQGFAHHAAESFRECPLVGHPASGTLAD